ncbi:hypothetical protein KY311_04840, partial [Candidatus Woesearchaeota archaeon]|nr:hypothetical protein [Candidatus Woesearchaeota archaeon]
MKPDINGFYSELSSILKAKKLDKRQLWKAKLKLCKKYRLKTVPTDIQVLLNTDIIVKTKPARTGSGVAIAALMTKPFP